MGASPLPPHTHTHPTPLPAPVCRSVPFPPPPPLLACCDLPGGQGRQPAAHARDTWALPTRSLHCPPRAPPPPPQGRGCGLRCGHGERRAVRHARQPAGGHPRRRHARAGALGVGGLAGEPLLYPRGSLRECRRGGFPRTCCRTPEAEHASSISSSAAAGSCQTASAQCAGLALPLALGSSGMLPVLTRCPLPRRPPSPTHPPIHPGPQEAAAADGAARGVRRAARRRRRDDGGPPGAARAARRGAGRAVDQAGGRPAAGHCARVWGQLDHGGWTKGGRRRRPPRPAAPAPLRARRQPRVPGRPTAQRACQLRASGADERVVCATRAACDLCPLPASSRHCGPTASSLSRACCARPLHNTLPCPAHGHLCRCPRC